jgi:hypothetical protein
MPSFHIAPSSPSNAPTLVWLRELCQKTGWLGLSCVLGLAMGLVTGCTSSTKITNNNTEASPVAQSKETQPPKFVSLARSPKEYRQDAAKHIYAFNQYRIHEGKLPPLLYAIGVVTFEVREDGKIQSFDWMRKPNQAPEVIREIERTIKAAEPFPAPIHLGRVRYTETWLWHKSGKFQLDTLTEGQI